MIYLELFWSFFQVGLFCVGGGYASMPLIQAQVIDIHAWLSMSEFIDIFTISQMTPGPIGINAATFVGMKVAGFLGAIVATLGFVTPSFILGIILAKLFFKYGNIGVIKGILNGLRPAVVALICSAGMSFIFLALFNTEKMPINVADIDYLGLFVLIVAFIAVRKKVGIIKILAGSGVLGLILGLIGKF
ncbi:chromate transporter [Megamonas rupellensis]|uniref:Chromate transporter, chromate ion transporter (CHR) family n=2 Tax=Megamonas TaxID=158846 RepID=A0A378NX43_9FIRM|nr:MULTISPECIES: chromate transporter [Megamonas]MBE5060401.1 chromate transporter [Megamonas funiformis]RGQ05109.1 chromate transporter [Megamonas rupellensis]STY72239.1 chromate transporter, chromate ion transporter (CHR) family [Megamonas hypermegale]